jgi:hypothetical protein
MKKALSYILAATIGFYGCNKKSDNVFSESPDERLNETLATYQKVLTGSQYGWKGYIYPPD